MAPYEKEELLESNHEETMKLIKPKRILNQARDKRKTERTIAEMELMPRAKIKRYIPRSYKDGAEGFIQWCNDFVCVPVYAEGDDMATWVRLGELSNVINPKTNRSSAMMWEAQCEVAREALQMENNRFIYRLIVFCWPRGDGKSLFACLIQLWKFFNWPRQQIMLGANSKEQTKFVHYDIIRDIIINSPRLYEMIGGERNIQEKEIRIVDAEGNVRSMIRSISSFSGIVSNITGYTFSEIFDMKNPKFFVQLDGSIRTIPNALGVIDSTVSAKDHILYKLYSNFMTGKSKTVFFSYRFSRRGDVEDYWNPNMDEDQLRDYETKFPLGDFERYFLNKWNSGNIKVFSKEMVEEISIIGADNYLLNHETIKEVLKERTKTEELILDLADYRKKGDQKNLPIYQTKQQFFTKRLQKVDNLYVLKDDYEKPVHVTSTKLAELGDKFQTDWAILAGLDMADPYAIRGKARSIITIVAKGLVGSLGNPFALASISPKYIYFLLMLAQAEKNSIDNIKDLMEEADSEYQGIDTLCSERYGVWDMEAWCEERSIKFEPVFPNYERQKEAFKEYFVAIQEGRYKAPDVHVPGSKNRDILREEHENFDHDPETKWFGSPEKNEVRGIQDDTVFSGMWCFFGGRLLTPSDFRPRIITTESFGYFQENRNLIGKY